MDKTPKITSPSAEFLKKKTNRVGKNQPVSIPITKPDFLKTPTEEQKTFYNNTISLFNDYFSKKEASPIDYQINQNPLTGKLYPEKSKEQTYEPPFFKGVESI